MPRGSCQEQHLQTYLRDVGRHRTQNEGCLWLWPRPRRLRHLVPKKKVEPKMRCVAKQIGKSFSIERNNLKKEASKVQK